MLSNMDLRRITIWIGPSSAGHNLLIRAFICLLDVLREPPKAFTITHLADNAAHEDLEGSDIGVSQIDFPLAGGEVGEAHVVTQFIFRGCIRQVNLVP